MRDAARAQTLRSRRLAARGVGVLWALQAPTTVRAVLVPQQVTRVLMVRLHALLAPLSLGRLPPPSQPPPASLFQTPATEATPEMRRATRPSLTAAHAQMSPSRHAHTATLLRV